MPRNGHPSDPAAAAAGWAAAALADCRPESYWLDRADAPPATPFHQSVIYEVHVRGATMTHPDVPPDLRGKYGGLASEPMIRYFKDLGGTALELLPIHAFVDDKYLLDRNLRNYWGYSSIAFFSPETRYRRKDYAGSAVCEFKSMAKALHAAGIEVMRNRFEP